VFEVGGRVGRIPGEGIDGLFVHASTVALSVPSRDTRRAW
jgi:hypothetical protein